MAIVTTVLRESRVLLIALSACILLLPCACVRSVPAESMAAEASAPGASSAIDSALCGLVSSIRAAIGMVVMALFLLGGLLYAASHFMPKELEFKKSMLSWAIAMMTGGVTGLVIVLAAQPLLTFIVNLGSSMGGSGVLAAFC